MSSGTRARWLERELPPALLRFIVLVCVMTGASFAYTWTMTRALGLQYPYGAPVFFHDDRWYDFTVYHDRFMAFRTPAFWQPFSYPFTYPATTGVLYGLLYRVPHVLRYYLLAYVLLACAGAVLLGCVLVRRGLGTGAAALFVGAALLTSWPLRVLLETANTEGVVALIAGLGVWALLRGRWWLGAALIGVAGSMKLFPLVLLGLLLSARRYREFAWGLLTAAAVTLASLAVLGPTVGEAQRHINEGIVYVKYVFVFAKVPMAADLNHSLFTPLKFLLLEAQRALHPADGTSAGVLERAARERLLLERTFTVYMVLAASLGTIAFFGWMRRLPWLNQLLALTVCSVLLPPLSVDYTLVHLLLPFALLSMLALERWRTGDRVPGLAACFTWFAVLFAYQNYMVLRYRLGAEVRTLALLCILWIVMRCRFPWQFGQGLGREPA